MAQEAQAWWTLQYRRYSIRELNHLPVFHRFLQIHYPFELSDSHAREKYATTDEVDTYEWEDYAAKKHEVFSHDRKTGKYSYELKYHDLESLVHIESWWVKEREGGAITRDYGAYQVVEGWAVEPGLKTYERFTVEKGVKRGFKSGIKGEDEDAETWIEELWSHDEETLFTKSWSQLGNSGGLTENKRGDYTWGESWASTTEGQEKKYWHKQGARDWGHHSGSDASKRWDHSWDFSEGKKYEEKVTVAGDRDAGYRLKGVGQDWYKQEWEGRKVVGAEEEADQVKEAGLRGRLDALYAAELAGSMQKQQTIATLASYFPEFQPQVAALASRRLAVNAAPRESVDNLLALLFSLRDLQTAQEKLNQEITSSMREDAARLGSLKKKFSEVLENSVTTVAHINPSKEFHFREAIEGWKGSQEAFFPHFETGFGLMTTMEVAKRDAAGLAQADVQKGMSTLYNIMVKHDAVSDKIVDIVNAADFKSQLDKMEDSFETIHNNYHQDKDPRRMLEMLDLLLEYQPIHLHLVGRIRGYSREEVEKELGEIATEAEGSSGVLAVKGARAKAKSTRAVKLTPFQVMDQNLNRFIPVLTDLLKQVSVPDSELSQLEEAAGRSVDSGEPVEVLSEKVAVIAEAGDKAASFRS